MHEKQLLDYLKGACLGRAYRVGSAELERALGVSSTDLRKIVNRLRRRGIPIASDRSGYFYAQTAGEVYTTKRCRSGSTPSRLGFLRKGSISAAIKS